MSGTNSMKVYLNMVADKERIKDGMVSMFNNFNAQSIDLDYERKNVRIFTFMWDSKSQR